MISLHLFEMSMCGADDHTKATKLIDALDLVFIDVIMPQLPECGWIYEISRLVVIQEFGSEKILQARKQDFWTSLSGDLRVFLILQFNSIKMPKSLWVREK